MSDENHKPKQNVNDMVDQAITFYSQGIKAKAFAQVCECLKFISKGVRRQFIDHSEQNAVLVELSGNSCPQDQALGSAISNFATAMAGGNPQQKQAA